MKHLDAWAMDLSRWHDRVSDAETCLVSFLSPMIYRGRGLPVMGEEEFRSELAVVVNFMIAKKQIRRKEQWWYLNRSLRQLQRKKHSGPKATSSQANKQLQGKSNKRKKKPSKRPRRRRAQPHSALHVAR